MQLNYATQILDKTSHILSQYRGLVSQTVEQSFVRTYKHKRVHAPQYDSIRSIAERVVGSISDNKLDASKYLACPSHMRMPKNWWDRLGDAVEEVVYWGEKGVVVSIADSMAFRIFALEKLVGMGEEIRSMREAYRSGKGDQVAIALSPHSEIDEVDDNGQQ